MVASVVLHKGEEPIISGEDGICNVFFAHCNLSCVYCQNFQISSNKNYSSQWLDSFDAIIYRIVRILDKGINVLGFVSPTHQVPQMVTIVEMLASKGYHPVIVYNSNAYDSPKVLRELN
ncbi:MAG TPA: 4Fe-4S cluster-binding domain-containing protein, partial [Tenuifilaceae bacterium]|nr:4Fe-4S cluster-binding domain-containing protein [Tenuifilaceae bacterium]